MTDNTIPEHIRILGISHKFWNIYNIYPYNITKVHLQSFDNVSQVI